MKVKNIMFSGFAAAILMGVAVEANAVPTAKIVASKGYVDTITGKLESLPTTDRSSLVDAIIELNGAKQNAFQDGTDATTTNGFISSVVQTNGKVDAEATAFDTEVSAATGSNTNTAPTTAAVYDAIQGVASDLDLAEVGGDGQYVKLVSQSDGRVAATAQGFDTTVSSTSTDANAPTSKAVYNAIENVAAQIPAMPDACQGTDNVCVLTSEDGTVYWSVLAKPYSNVIEGDATTIENGMTAQQQLISTDSLPEAVSGM